jgi:DNA-directed RNA polymerase subunit RPC12/RpoP
MTDKLELMKCHHCGHEWEPRVKRPKKCPQCQNPLWVSPRPKRKAHAPMPTVPSEAAAPAPPTTDTNTGEAAVSGVGEPASEPVETLEPIYTRVEVGESETAVQRLQREAEERLRRLADAPID